MTHVKSLEFLRIVSLEFFVSVVVIVVLVVIFGSV